MRLVASDPDIETLLKRIERKHLDLQPDFQRGEVWSQPKKRKLIDSILRQWHIPPIHVVETEEDLEVLDGQQRLVSIRDFFHGGFSVDGNTEPLDPDIQELHNLSFHSLPKKFKERFLSFSIRQFKVVDYEPEEPAELFYRLNQAVTLTSPEQRNAFYGDVRDEIRQIVKKHLEGALQKDFLGFSNSRMSYDDVVSRACFILEAGTLRTKITASKLANRYRDGGAFPEQVTEKVDQVR